MLVDGTIMRYIQYLQIDVPIDNVIPSLCTNGKLSLKLEKWFNFTSESQS